MSEILREKTMDFKLIVIPNDDINKKVTFLKSFKKCLKILIGLFFFAP